MELNKREIRVFVCYAHEDMAWLKEGDQNLIPYLRDRFKSDNVSFWWDEAIAGGEEWENRILNEINEADIALPLISGNLVNSEFITETELLRLKRRHAGDGLEVVPILVGTIGESGKDRLAWIFGLQVIPNKTHSLEETLRDKHEWSAARESIVDQLDKRIKKLRDPSNSKQELEPIDDIVQPCIVVPDKRAGRRKWAKVAAAIVIAAIVAAFAGALIVRLLSAPERAKAGADRPAAGTPTPTSEKTGERLVTVVQPYSVKYEQSDDGSLVITPDARNSFMTLKIAKPGRYALVIDGHPDPQSGLSLYDLSGDREIEVRGGSRNSESPKFFQLEQGRHELSPDIQEGNMKIDFFRLAAPLRLTLVREEQ
jgi:hypothetical protein